MAQAFYWKSKKRSKTIRGAAMQIQPIDMQERKEV
jgi:hypothetical protein